MFNKNDGLAALLSFKAPKLEIYEDSAKQWRWRIYKSSDIVAASTEGYSSKQKAIDNILAIEQHIKYLRENNKIP